ncbi:hypothetical protein, partial [Levilactobacillus brevis]|uniref:hypothetical protein n=1 Tax=Levilactobacillus brevis TaxID=1580 RepID=UPI0021A3D241
HLNVLIGIHQSRSSCLIYVIKFVQVISCNLPKINHLRINSCIVSDHPLYLGAVVVNQKSPQAGDIANPWQLLLQRLIF